MKGLTALVAGAITAVLAAALWMAISYYANFELGIIAWAIGAAVGFAVFAGGGREGGVGLGMLAVVLALAGIALGKLGAVYLVVHGALDDEQVAISAVADEIIYQQEKQSGQPVPMPYVKDEDVDSIGDLYPANIWSQAEYQLSQMTDDDRERLIQAPALANETYYLTHIADMLVEERMEAGQQINWPNLVGYEDAFHEEDYPKDIWADAVARWNAMSEDEQQQYQQDIYDEQIALRAQYEPMMRADAIGQAFGSSFSAFDILWGILAVVSAFRIGSSGSESRAAAA